MFVMLSMLKQYSFVASLLFYIYCADFGNSIVIHVLRVTGCGVLQAQQLKFCLVDKSPPLVSLSLCHSLLFFFHKP